MTWDTNKFQKFHPTQSLNVYPAIDDSGPSPWTAYNEEDWVMVLKFLAESVPEDGVAYEAHAERILYELGFFEYHSYQNILIGLLELTVQFEQDGIVWGVGRGSSCASYILFLLGIHNVNSLLYNIPFDEFSKET